MESKIEELVGYIEELELRLQKAQSQIEDLQGCMRQTLNIAQDAQKIASKASDAVKTAQDGVDFTLKMVQDTQNRVKTAQEGVDFTLELTKNNYKIAIEYCDEIKSSIVWRATRPIRLLEAKFKNHKNIAIEDSPIDKETLDREDVEDIKPAIDIDKDINIEKGSCRSDNSPETQKIYSSLKSKTTTRCLLLGGS